MLQVPPVRLRRNREIDLVTGDFLPLDLRDGDVDIRETQRARQLLDERAIQPRIEQRAEAHVPGDARKWVENRDARHRGESNAWLLN